MMERARSVLRITGGSPPQRNETTLKLQLCPSLARVGCARPRCRRRVNDELCKPPVAAPKDSRTAELAVRAADFRVPLDHEPQLLPSRCKKLVCMRSRLDHNPESCGWAGVHDLR